MAEKNILLIVGGGIAAYKSLELIRLLARHNVSTHVILTKAGEAFVTPLSLAGLSGKKVHQDLLDPDDETQMGHIQLSRSADMIVVCPATANLIARTANGMADDLATTALLASDKPILMIPAMNVRMWENPATQSNIKTLQDRDILIMDPDEGNMACGEYGVGRLPEPPVICERILHELDMLSALNSRLNGKRILITAGPTIEAIDPVRFISNRSSGKQGYAIAQAAARAGADVILVTGPTALTPPVNVTTHHVESAQNMLTACQNALPVDVFISVAAVADWRPSNQACKKIKKQDTSCQSIELIENPDILQTLAKANTNRPELVIGFAAETHNVETFARSKLHQKGCDWIIANDISGDVMGGEDNQILLMDSSGIEHWPLMSKPDMAQKLIAHIANVLTSV